MMMYGKLFDEYFEEKKKWLDHEWAYQIWSTLGVMAHLSMVFLGTLMVTPDFFLIWTIAVVVSSLLIVSSLLGWWWRSRKFNNFEDWLKHRERTSKRSKKSK